MTIGVDVLVRLRDKLSGPLRDTEGAVAKAAERMQKRLQFSMHLSGAADAASRVASGTTNMIAGFTNSIRDVERAKGELATLGVRDLDAVVRKGREMQAQLAGVTADAFVRASYDIKSGIASLTDQGVADMTASAMIVAKATKGQAEQMTSLFATSYGIFKKQMGDLTDAQFGEQFGAALAASVQQFKTDGSKMQQAIESAGAGAVNLGMAMTEQMALLGMMQQQMQAGEAGTALRAFAANAAKAHEEFGKMKITAEHPVRVRILDEKGQLRAMPDILADLRKRYGETLDAFEAAEIQKAFGTEEAMKLINALYGQEAAVRANAEALGEAAQKGNEFTAEMARAADNNWDAKAALMAQKFDILKQKIGEKLLPVVERLIPVIDDFLTRAFAWIDANPELVTGIGAVVALVAGLATVLTPLLLGLSAMVSGFALASYGLTAFAAIASPIGLIVAGIAGAAYLIYRYWEPIKGFFSALWARVKSVFSWAWEGIKGLLLNYTAPGLIYSHWDGIAAWFTALWGRLKGVFSAGWEGIKWIFLNYTAAGLVYRHWDGIAAWFASLWARVKGAFSGGWEGIRAEVATWPSRMMQFGADLIQALIDGIRSRFEGLGAAVSEAMAKLNPFSGAKVTVNMDVVARQSAQAPGSSGLSADRQAEALAKQRERLDRLGVPPVQARASGGVFGPGPLLTGEEGAELMYASEGGYIAHNRALRGMMDMAARTSRMMRGIGGGVGSAVAPMAALASVAGAGAVATPRPMTFAPQYSIPLTINGGSATDANAIVALVRRELMAAEERARVDARRLIHD